MKRSEVEAFFIRERGRTYDPLVVDAMLANLESIERQIREVTLPQYDLWGMKRVDETRKSVRPLEHIQPTIAYKNALATNPTVQRELVSVFELTRADFHGLDESEALSILSGKLERILQFDAAAFFLADMETGEVTAAYVAGPQACHVAGLVLRLEQKLTGWVAANNQALVNLPPFPDFLAHPQTGHPFAMSAIAPMNRAGTIIGALSVYRISPMKFSDQEFRWIEILASQAAVAISNIRSRDDEQDALFDGRTSLPNAFQLHLMFEPVSVDAQRYEYSVTLLMVTLDDSRRIKRRLGSAAFQEVLRAVGAYVRQELRETDLIVSYASDGFVIMSPGVTREHAEALKSRLQDILDHNHHKNGVESVVLAASVGIAVYPQDGSTLGVLLSSAETALLDDRHLRTAVRSKVRSLGRD